MAGDRTETSLAKEPTPRTDSTTGNASVDTETSSGSDESSERSKEIILRRRLATRNCSEHSFNTTSVAERDRLRTLFETRGLRTGIAFSGGGIRSATISLGLTEALAARGRFYAIDMMSTVSGGGYFGTFLSSLFIEREADNGRAENIAIVENRLAFADAVITSLPDQQYFRSNGHSSYFVKPLPGSDNDNPKTQTIKNPLWWLRENGRYLAPNGMTDYLFALAYFVRNWITVMVAILAAMLLIFAALHLIMLGIHACAPDLTAFKAAANAARDSSIPWSPLLTLLPLGLLIAGGIGLGYWFSLGLTTRPAAPDRDQDVWRLGRWWIGCGVIITGLLLFDLRDDRLAQMLERGAMVILLSALMSSAINAIRRDPPPEEKNAQAKEKKGDPKTKTCSSRADLWLCLSCLLGTALAGLVIANMAGWAPTSKTMHFIITILVAVTIVSMTLGVSRDDAVPFSVRNYRRLQTGWLMKAAMAVAILCTIGLVDTLGLFVRDLSNATEPASFARTALTSSALLSLVAALVAKLPDWLGGSKLGIVRLLKAKVNAAAFIAALLMLISLAVLADMLILKTLWKDPAWAPDASVDLAAFGVLSAVTVCIVLLIGRSKEFLNQSALAPIYASRLSRAYLGGSNCYRLATHTSSDVTRSMVGDDMDIKYYMKQASAAPLHFINVTRNRTTGTANRDAVTDNDKPKDDPFVIGKGGHQRRRLEGYDSHLTLRDRKGDRMVIGPAGIRAGAEFFSWEDTLADSDKGEPLHLGQLCAISGAAVSSGMGRNTSLGTAMALTLANVRLGHWWRAPGKNASGKPSIRSKPGWLGKCLPAYDYLIDELIARYDRDKPHWYLSDGGHSENSGALTLLERNCRFILVADNGQDPDSHFADLETFTRAARTDIGMEVVAASRAELASVIRRDARSCFLNNKPDAWDAQLASPDNEAFALLLKATDMEMIENGERRLSTEAPSWIVWLKPTLFKGLPVDITTYGRLNPDFPQQSTANQFFDEAQWESYRRLGFAMGYRLFADPHTLADELPPIFQALKPRGQGKAEEDGK